MLSSLALILTSHIFCSLHRAHINSTIFRHASRYCCWSPPLSTAALQASVALDRSRAMLDALYMLSQMSARHGSNLLYLRLTSSHQSGDGFIRMLHPLGQLGQPGCFADVNVEDEWRPRGGLIERRRGGNREMGKIGNRGNWLKSQSFFFFFFSSIARRNIWTLTE